MFGRILIAFDGSPISAQALETGIELAKSLKSTVGLVTVVNPHEAISNVGGIRPAELVAEMRQEAKLKLRTAGARVDAEEPPYEFIREGAPAREILATAQEWGADLIVVGSPEHSLLERLLFGDTSDSVVHSSRYPVLVVRPTTPGHILGPRTSPNDI
ncbi:MAG TPA: universal stress protein [Nitrospira sp.]|nr:universal stress protein [Nitrospira sp.]